MPPSALTAIDPHYHLCDCRHRVPSELQARILGLGCLMPTAPHPGAAAMVATGVNRPIYIQNCNHLHPDDYPEVSVPGR